MALADSREVGGLSVEPPGTEFAAVDKLRFCTVLTFSRQTSSCWLLVWEPSCYALHAVLTASANDGERSDVFIPKRNGQRGI